MGIRKTMGALYCILRKLLLVSISSDKQDSKSTIGAPYYGPTNFHEQLLTSNNRKFFQHYIKLDSHNYDGRGYC